MMCLLCSRWSRAVLARAPSVEQVVKLHQQELAAAINNEMWTPGQCLLTQGRIIQLRVQGPAIKSNVPIDSYRVDGRVMSAMDFRNTNVLVSIANEQDCQYKPQKDQGVSYFNDTVTMFRVVTEEPRVGFTIRFYDADKTQVGQSVIEANKLLNDNRGFFKLDIKNQDEVLGEMKSKYSSACMYSSFTNLSLSF